MISVNMRQWTILTFIQRYCEEHGRAPTVVEIRVACKLSHHPLQAALAPLIARGVAVRLVDCWPVCIALAMNGQKVLVTP